MTTGDNTHVWLDGITLQVADFERSLKLCQRFPGLRPASAPTWRRRILGWVAYQRPSALAASIWARPEGRIRLSRMRCSARSLLRKDQVDLGLLGW